MDVEEEDLSREIFPLSHYASNRKRLIEEAFSILKGHRLESTIPASLRGIDSTELKALCLEELEKIDTLRIVDVIEGRLTSTSKTAHQTQYSEKRDATKRKSSEGEGEASIPVSVLKKKIKKSMQKENLEEEERGRSSVKEKPVKESKKKKEKKKKKSKKADMESPGSESKKKGKTKVKSKGKGKKSKKKKGGKAKKKAEKEEALSKPPAVPGERTLMELLELEYRAKAIKALLKFQGFGNNKLDEVFDDNEGSREDAVPTGNSQQGNSVSSSSSSGSEKSVQKGDLEPEAGSSNLKTIQKPMMQPAGGSTSSISGSEKSIKKLGKESPVEISPVVSPQKVPSRSEGSNTSGDSDSLEEAKKREETIESVAVGNESDDDRDSISSEESFTEDNITNSLKPPVPNSGSDSKFELSIDVDDDLDYGNPDEILDDLPLPPDSVVNSDNESDEDKVNEASSVRSRSPPNNILEDYSEEEGEILFESSSRSRSSKFRSNKFEDSSIKNFRITVQNNSRRCDVGSDIESEDDFQTESNNHATSSPIRSPVRLESISESEEGELMSGNEDEVREEAKQTPVCTSSASSKAEIKVPALEVGGTAEAASNNPSAVTIRESPSKNDQPTYSGSPPSEALTKVTRQKIPETLPNVDEDLDYEEPDDDEALLNINCPPPVEYPEDATPIIDYPDDAEPISEYPNDAEQTAEYPDEATPVTWYERWYSSKKVQKLVNSTKMCGKVRNKMRSEKKNQIKEPVKKAEPDKTIVAKVDEPDIPIIGSIEEYEKLFGKKIVSQNLDTTPAPVNSEGNKSPAKSSDAEADEEEEDDDDELWGDIMGNT